MPEFRNDFQSRAITERAGTFTDNMKLPIHRWFRYSARFLATWVEGVIAELEPKIVLDPFAGSDTVCIAADKLGVTSWLRHPTQLVIIISKVAACFFPFFFYPSIVSTSIIWFIVCFITPVYKITLIAISVKRFNINTSFNL
ncbi:hypothetical protein [Nostoc sp.]|uniref:hypothetical protein n=1 Tax=Nostoc sp. TaxID=1180 RepID=UPI002FF4B180